MNDLMVNHLDASEIEILRALAESIWYVCYKDLITPGQIEYMLAQRYQAHTLRQRLLEGDIIFAARLQGQLVGFAHTCLLDDRTCKLDKLYVSNDHQRKGIGEQLVNAVEDYARKQHCEQLVLRVYKGNQNALCAYSKYGFTILRQFKEDIGNGYFMDDCVLGKPL